jgi:hypothetical protein
MRKALILLAIAAALFLNCNLLDGILNPDKGSDNDTDPNTPPALELFEKYAITATVAGESFNSTHCAVSLVTHPYRTGWNLFYIQATDSSASRISS